jgi:hypothetical protein
MWVKGDQQPIWKKGGGRAIHVSDFISETIGRLKLSEEQISDQHMLPAKKRLPKFEARAIIYLGKGFDAWWDLKQLIVQIKNTISIFELMHPDHTGVFLFDRSSAHEGFAEDALNINRMNVNPGGKQKRLRDTIIPLNNPDPAPGKDDTRGRVQHMYFPDDFHDPKLRGQAKGVRVVLMERKSIWDKYTAICTARKAKIVRKCASCTKSQTRKDAENWVAMAEVMGQGDTATMEDTALIESEMPSSMNNEWCCMHHVLSLQEDFRTEKPLVQSIIEDAGYVCLFLPCFHCELNAIELLWGFAKHRAHAYLSHARESLIFRPPGYRKFADERFSTAKVLVEQCLDACDLITIHRFFWKTWRYIDAYQ